MTGNRKKDSWQHGKDIHRVDREGIDIHVVQNNWRGVGRII
jgi:hypothetical protein